MGSPKDSFDTRTPSAMASTNAPPGSSPENPSAHRAARSGEFKRPQWRHPIALGLITALGAYLGTTACTSSPASPSPLDASAGPTGALSAAQSEASSFDEAVRRLSLNKLEGAQSLTAGFASVDFTWRAGAKPGQVGTDANVFQIALLWKDLIHLILPAYRYQKKNQVLEELQMATDWTVDYLNDRIDDMPYDQYVDVFEPGRGVHTRTSAKAFVAESNGTKVAVVRADLYLMQKVIWRRVGELVAAQTGLKPENILIAATHNHSAADATFTAAGISTLAETFDSRHWVWVTNKIAEAIIKADQARVPAKMGAIRTKLREVQRNIIGPSTASVVPPGETTAVTVQAGYPRDYFDDDLSLVYFQNATTGAKLGAYVVFGMHPESLYEGHGMLSAEFFGLMENGLESRWGFPVMWSPGALGDVEPDDGTNFGTDFWREDFQRLEEQAAVLVDSVGPVLEEAPKPSDLVVTPRGDIVVNSRMRLFPGPPNTSYPGPTPWQVPVTEYLSPDWPIACARALTETTNLMLQSIQLGDVVLLASPSEITTDLSKHIKSRVDSVEGNLYQGYVWPDAEVWVEEEINQNFDNTELPSTQGFYLPIVLSQSNDYMGYMVTRWEFNNRHHYRQEMTLYGEETANYVAAGFEDLVLELRGGSPKTYSFDEPSTLDLTLENDVYNTISSLESVVAEWSRKIPSQDKARIGKVEKGPELVADDELGVPAVHFGWKGGTSDLPLPVVTVERDTGNGVYETVTTDAGPHVWLLYSRGGSWEAVWHLKDYPGPGTYRFLVRGQYRGAENAAGPVDVIWDPDGRNVSYSVVSIPITVP